MASSTSLVFNIIGNNQASGALNSVGSSFSKLGGVVKTAGVALAGAAVTAGAMAGVFGVKAVGAASDLNETMSKSSVIFGEQAAAISKWGDTAATTLGLSKNQAVGAAASFGDMFRQLGFAGDQAAGMSKDVVKLAADLGSFNNLGTDEVLDMLSGAFRGEYDSLQRVIPNISAARVETEALAETGKKAAKDLTAQEKAAATLAIVMQDGSRANGDFARTSNGLANEQKILGAQFEDIKAKVGTALLPMLTKLGGYAVNTLMPAVGQFASTLSDRLGPALTQAGRWIQTNLLPPARELWSWVQEHMIPAVVNLATQIGGGLMVAFNMIRDKIEENKPQLQQLWQWFVTIESFLMDRVYPVLAVILKGALVVAGVWISALIVQIGMLVDAANWVAGAVRNTAAWIVNAWDNAYNGVAGAINSIVAFFSNLYNGAAGAVGLVVDYVGGIPGRVLGAVGDLGSLLYNAGRAVLTGFWDGLKSVWGDVKSWVSGIAGTIADLKGPLDYDRKLLIPAGAAIMAGLGQGLAGGFKGVQQMVSGMAPDLQANVTANVSGVARGGGQNTGSAQPVTLVIEGSGDLVDWLRKSIRVKGGSVQAVLGS